MKNIEIPSLARSPSGDQELQLAPGLPGLPERLLLAHAQGRVLIIAGAGVSMQPPSCLPDFGSLVRGVCAKLDKAIGAHLDEPTDGRGIGGIKGSLPPLDAEQTAILGRLDEKEYDVALGMLERRMDRDQERESTVRRAVAGILRKTGSHAPIHTSLVRLANRGGAATIATTNFDLLLERAAKALRTPLQRYALHDIPRPSLRPEFAGVLHLHGALDQNPERHPDLVLTDRDFGEYYLRRRAIPDLIYDAARIFHVVLVGYSLGDPPMRYLLNAVAADGQRFSDLKERFAFVGMDWSSDQAASEKRQAELATWIGRGITPIPYDKADGHRALAKVLAAWAKLSPYTALDNADKEVRRIFRLQRAAASEASAALFGHIFRRSSDEAQVRIAKAHRNERADPAWLDGMLEIVRETGNIADREAHASRLCQVALDERLTEPTLLKWAAKLRGHQTAERRAVLELLQLRLDGKIPESWRTAWGVIAEAQLAADTDRQGFQDYLLSNRLKEGDRSGTLIAEVARLVAPRLSVEWRSEVPLLSGRTAKKFRDVNDILHLSVVSSTVEMGRGLNLEAVSEVDFLIELAEALEAEVARGLHIGRRIGWHADRDLAWLGGLDRVRLRSNGKHDDPDRFHQGIAPAVRLLMHTIDRLTRLESAAARPFIRRWLTRSDPVHVRMWAAAALEPLLATACPSSNHLRPLCTLSNGVSGPSVVEVRLRFGDASSGVAGWFCA
ncbi:MAG: SIR2 family protein [Roseomonas sp.]|nr:SIR2 family protein [Roseomonas sp.]